MTAQPKTSTAYQTPFRPWPVRVFNRLPQMRAQSAVFDPDRLLRYAKKTTGETISSDAPLLEPLTQLCQAIITEAQLSPFGRIVQETRLKTLLMNRLRLDALMRAQPDILAQPAPNVIAITGLARTGTTLLQRTLAADPDARSLPSWEALNPAPFPDEDRTAPKKRIRMGEHASQMMAWLAPDFSAVHPVSAHDPEEDILLLDLTFMSQTSEAVMHVPSFSHWLETQDHTLAYAYLRDVLKVLTWLRPGQHWVLKTPNHSEQLAALLAVFPNALIVQTHRDPQRTFPSCCSLMAHSQGLSTDKVDPHAIGAHWLRKVARMADTADAARAANPMTRFIDIQYQDLIGDPLGCIKRIYEAGQITLAPTAKAAMERRLVAPRPAAHREHVYNLADFGLSVDDIDQTFGAYCKRYMIPAESARQ